MRMIMNENQIFCYNYVFFWIVNVGLVNFFIYNFVNFNILLLCNVNFFKINFMFICLQGMNKCNNILFL